MKKLGGFIGSSVKKEASVDSEKQPSSSSVKTAPPKPAPETKKSDVKVPMISMKKVQQFQEADQQQESQLPIPSQNLTKLYKLLTPNTKKEPSLQGSSRQLNRVGSLYQDDQPKGSSSMLNLPGKPSPSHSKSSARGGNVPSQFDEKQSQLLGLPSFRQSQQSLRKVVQRQNSVAVVGRPETDAVV